MIMCIQNLVYKLSIRSQEIEQKPNTHVIQGQ